MKMDIAAALRSVIREEALSTLKSIAVILDEQAQQQEQFRREITQQLAGQRLYYDGRFDDVVTQISTMNTRSQGNSLTVSSVSTQNSDWSLSEAGAAEPSTGTVVSAVSNSTAVSNSWSGAPAWAPGSEALCAKPQASLTDQPAAAPVISRLYRRLQDDPNYNPKKCMLCHEVFKHKRFDRNWAIHAQQRGIFLTLEAAIPT